MIIPLPSKQKAFRLRLGIVADATTTLRVHAWDRQYRDCYYIRRRVPFGERLFSMTQERQGYKSFSLPFPQSPQTLELLIKADQNTAFEVVETQVEHLEVKPTWLEPEMQRYLGFAEKLSREVMRIGPGYVESPDGAFLVQLLPVIRDSSGQVQQTPARINRLTGRIQISLQHFARYTVPVRLFILLHERYHYQLNDRSERGPDLAALRLMLSLGYPETELVYAASRIFLAHPDNLGRPHAERVRDIHQVILQHRNSA